MDQHDDSCVLKVYRDQRMYGTYTRYNKTPKNTACIYTRRIVLLSLERIPNVAKASYLKCIVDHTRRLSFKHTQIATFFIQLNVLVAGG